MRKLWLLAVGAAALAVGGFSSAASAHDRVSFGLFLGGPPEPIIVGPPPLVVEEHYYDPEEAYWAHRQWEDRERWEAYQRWLAYKHCEHERREHAYWRHRWDDEDGY